MNCSSRIIRRIALLFLTGALLTAPAGVYCSEKAGSEDWLQGNKAFEAGDHASAVRFYKKALVLSGSPLWEKCAMQLGKVYLKQGDISSAAEILSRLKKRAPQFPADILSGMILAAENNFDSAIKVFRKAAARNGQDRPEALYQLGNALLNTGNHAEALKIFEELDKSSDPKISRRGRYAGIYTLIHSRKHKEADKLLAETPVSPETAQLKLLNQVKSGDLDAFKAAWLKQRQNTGDPRPEKQFYEICRLGADLAESRDPDFAVICLDDCFKFAPGDTERQYVMHRLFNLQSGSDIDGAVKTVDRYCAIFSNASDKVQLLLQCGRLLAANNRFKEAVEVFARVIKDEDNLFAERRSAAFDAAGAAEKGGMIKEAEKLHFYLINRSTTPEEKQKSEFNCGQFFVRQKNYAAAEKYFDLVILQNGSLAEDARYHLLSVLIDTRQYARAKETAARLLEAQKPEYANYARFRLAGLTELEGDLSLARKLYLEYLNKAPSSSLAPAAAFAAAQLAEKTGNLTIAAAEYLAFVRKYPADINAASSLFLALRADCLSGGKQIAEKSIALMSEKHAQTAEYNAALLQLADYYFNHRDHARALELLKKQNDRNTHAAAFMLLECRILQAAGKSTAALQLAKELLKKYPDAPETVEAHFFCGNILADLGENGQALEHFKQAESSGVSGIMAEVISGRIADCASASYSGGEFDRKQFNDALKRYLKLAEEAKLPAVKLQSLCKAGNCYARLNDQNRALEYYEKTLYFAALLQNNHFQPDPVWCARAAYAGARVAFKGKKPDKLSRALRLTRLYEELALPATGEDFYTLRKQLRDAYNLLKRKGQ